MRAEKTQRAEAKAEELPTIWSPRGSSRPPSRRIRRRRSSDIAKAEMLDQAMLRRCVKLVEKAAAGFEMMRKMTASEKEVRRRRPDDAEAGQGDDRPKGQARQDEDRAAQQPLYGDNWVFQLSDAQVRALLPEEKKKKLDDMTTTLAKLQKSDDAKPLPIAHGLAEASAGEHEGLPPRQSRQARRRGPAPLPAHPGRRRTAAVHARQRPARTGRSRSLARTTR